MSETDLLAIGELATATGVTVSALRYYDELGIVAPATRVGGKRRFTTNAIGQVSFVRRAQAAGFSLDDIRLILDDEQRQWPEMVRGHLADLHERRDQLDIMIAMLEEVARCGCEVVANCPLVNEC